MKKPNQATLWLAAACLALVATSPTLAQSSQAMPAKSKTPENDDTVTHSHDTKGRTYVSKKLLEQKGKAKCGNGDKLRIEPGTNDPMRAMMEPVLVSYAAKHGKKLVLKDSTCSRDGVMTAKGVELEPEEIQPEEACSLPYARSRIASCK